jgi:hypothetical protein
MSEHALQVAVAHMLQIVLDPQHTWWSAIDHGAGKLSKRAAGMMKARGVHRGLPDFIVLTNGWHVLGIELKAGKGQLSDAQQLVAREWQMLGHGYYVVRSLEDVQRLLEHWGVPLRRRMTIFPTVKVPHVRPKRPAPARHRRARRQRKSKNHLPLVLAHAAQKK